MPRKKATPVAPVKRVRKPKALTEVQRVAKALLERTIRILGEAFEAKTPAAKTKTKPLSAQHKAIVNAFNEGSWGCQTDSVRNLLCALISEDLRPHMGGDNGDDTELDTSLLVPGLLLVPTECENSHDYPLGECCMVTSRGDNEDMLRLDGNTGNCLDMELRYLRLPTLVECERFVEANLSALEDYNLIVA